MSLLDVELGEPLQIEQSNHSTNDMLALEIETPVEEKKDDDEKHDWKLDIFLIILWASMLYACKVVYDRKMANRKLFVPEYWDEALNVDSEWQTAWRKDLWWDSTLNENWQKFPAVFSATGNVVPGEEANLSIEQFHQELKDTSSPLVVNIHASWCGPCRLYHSVVKFTAKFVGARARVVRVEAGSRTPEAEALCSEFQVHLFPTVVFFANGVLKREASEQMLQPAQIMKAIAEANR